MLLIQRLFAFCLVSLLFLSSGAQARPLYTITDLGVSGTSDFRPVIAPNQSAALNNTGGYVYTLVDATEQFRSFYSDGSTTVDLGTLNGKYSVARAINDVGAITGYSDAYSSYPMNNAFVYQDGTLQSIHTLGYDATSDAYSINSHGVVVGEFNAGFGFPVEIGNAFIFDPAVGEMQNLQTILPVSTLNGSWVLRRANAINDAGQIVGYGMFRDGNTPFPPGPILFPGGSASGSVQRGFFYNGSEIINIGTLEGGYVSMAIDINAAGVVVGHSGLPDGSIHAVIYNENSLVDLGTLSEKGVSGNSFALSVNNLNQVVGDVQFDNTSRAFIYDTKNGMRDLNSLISKGAGWDSLASAWDINDAGQIIGLGYINGVAHVYLLNPTDISDIPCQHSEKACEVLQNLPQR